MTMLCWLYPGGQDGPIFNYENSGSWGVHFWVVAGKLFVRFIKRDYSHTNSLEHTLLKPEDGWKFVGASYDHASGDAKLWIDGNVVQTLNIGANLQLGTQDSVRMGVRIGDRRYFKGRIAQMQVYNVSLTQQQIQLIKDRIQLDVCQKPLGMESGLIKDAQISASSQWDANHAAVQARLHFKAGGGKEGGWSARASNQNQWLQVDLGDVTSVKVIGTQGRNGGGDQWVTSYKLQYSNDVNSFLNYKDPGSSTDKIFTANTDRDTVVYHTLSLPSKVRYIRVVPWTWHNHISMRMELYGCPGKISVTVSPSATITVGSPSAASSTSVALPSASQAANPTQMISPSSTFTALTSTSESSVNSTVKPTTNASKMSTPTGPPDTTTGTSDTTKLPPDTTTGPAVTCQTLSPPTNGELSGCNTTEMLYDTVCRFSCKEGSEASGSTVRRCTENGTWSGNDLVCTVTLFTEHQSYCISQLL
ncbi:uncharacterized protein LOC144629051 isoform X2 [Oculina patagonica]